MNKKSVLSNLQNGILNRNALPFEIRNDQSKNFHILASNSHLILSSSTSDIVISGNLRVLSNFQSNTGNEVTGSTNFFTINRLDSQGIFLNSSGSLILSSSAGSVVALSASTDFVNSDKPYHIRSVNSHLILSSSAGSIVAFSSSADFKNSDKNYHIRAINSHLILSSSAGSITTVSGTMTIFNDVGVDGLLITGSSASRKGIIIRAPVGQQASIILGEGTGDIWQIGKQTDNTWFLYNSELSTNVLVASASNIGPAAGKLVNTTQHLIFSSSAGSIVFISSSLIASGTQHSFTGSVSIFANTNPTLGISSGSTAVGYFLQLVNSDGTNRFRILDAISISGANSNIGIGGTPNVSAKLDVQGTAGALLIPRLTDAQKDSLTPAAGMMIYNTTSSSFNFYDTTWKIVTLT